MNRVNFEEKIVLVVALASIFFIGFFAGAAWYNFSDIHSVLAHSKRNIILKGDFRGVNVVKVYSNGTIVIYSNYDGVYKISNDSIVKYKYFELKHECKRIPVKRIIPIMLNNTIVHFTVYEETYVCYCKLKEEIGEIKVYYEKP